MKKAFIIYMAMTFLCVASSQAQSIDFAKSLIVQEQYREAAQQLRPLAESGNSEAQFLAAQLFFEGKGVVKSDAQGEKYATMAANQGNEKAIVLLAEHYYLKNNQQKMFSTLSTAVSKHPYMGQKLVGAALALCYMNGLGVPKDVARGQQLLSKCSEWENSLQEASPKLASMMPAVVSDVKVVNMFGREGGRQHTYVYVDDKEIGATFTLQSNKPHPHLLDFTVMTANGTPVSQWSHDVSVGGGINTCESYNPMTPLAEGKYALAISEPETGMEYVRAPFYVYSLEQKRQNEWNEKKGRISVSTRPNGLIKARLEDAVNNYGTVEVTVVVTTRMVRRQLKVGAVTLTDAYGRTLQKKTQVKVRGIPFLSGVGRNYYVLTDQDTAYFTVAISNMYDTDQIGELVLHMDLSGTQEYVKVNNVVWR